MATAEMRPSSGQRPNGAAVIFDGAVQSSQKNDGWFDYAEVCRSHPSRSHWR